jgi:hypothetical protein
MATATFSAFDPNSIECINAILDAPDTEPEVEPTVEPPLGLFMRIATPMIGRNVPVIPLRARTKIAFKSNWMELASIDPVMIGMWDMENPEYNGACVAFAKLDGVWFLDTDDPSIWKRIENETGKKVPRTFTVSSSPGKGHRYFKQTAGSIALGNRGGKDADGKESWSARIDNRYVVAANSIHPDTGEAYTVVDESPIVEAPDWLVEWLKGNAFDSKPDRARVNASLDGPPIPRGSHDNELFRIGCMLRNAGMDYDQIKDNLVQICEKRCADHGSDYVDMCERKSKQACGYAVGKAEIKAVLGGGTAEQRAKDQQAAKDQQSRREQSVRDQQSRRESAPAPEPDEDDIPEFDESVITGIYRDIVTLAVGGTTIPAQFALLNAKVYFGARLAGKATFEGLDCDSCYYGTAIGVTEAGHWSPPPP